ncbi:hypothetical protein ACRPK2_09265 [Lactococcus garvieae]|uniref:hypothetical protein n=1 Tax=Lactococcus garvieae TaxID=1363 RepID=UPI003D76E76E
MRKIKYEVKVEPYLEGIKQWRVERLSLLSIAKNLGMSLSTLDKFRKVYPELEEALKVPELTPEEMTEKERQKIQRNRNKYCSSTYAFIRRRATEEERYRIVQLVLAGVTSQEELNRIGDLVEREVKQKNF